jgi:hypothetical protein
MKDPHDNTKVVRTMLIKKADNLEIVTDRMQMVQGGLTPVLMWEGI